MEPLSWIFNYGQTWQVNDDKIERDFIIVGADKEDIKISVSGSLLYILFDGNDYTGRVEHKWRLPDGVSAKDVSSKYEAGVLTVSIQKPKDFEHKIPIR